MTLAEVLPTVRLLPALDKLRLIRILAQELETLEDISPLERGKVYDLPTPYDSFGAGKGLMDMMKVADQNGT